MTHRRICSRYEDRRGAAEAIAGEQRRGVIDGVEVDFSHPDLPSEWEARPFWYVWGPPPVNSGILFPSEAEAAPLELLREQKLIDDDFPVVAALPGDRITVEHVTPAIEDGRFDHPHDARSMLAYLRIERPSGAVLHPPGPLAFYGKTQIRNGALRETFDHMVERICSYAGDADLYGRDPTQSRAGRFWELSLEDIALSQAQKAHDSFFRLLDGLPSDDNNLSRAHLRSLVNAAALAGFALGKVEARRPEKIAAGVMDNREKATSKVIRMDWREKAIALWQANPTWTINRVANAIAEGSHDDPRSIRRGIERLAPPTSNSRKPKVDSPAERH